MHEIIPFIRIASLIRRWIFLSKIILTWKEKQSHYLCSQPNFTTLFLEFTSILKSKPQKWYFLHSSHNFCIFQKKKSWRFLEISLQAHKNPVRWLRDLDFWESWSPNTTIRVRRLSRGRATNWIVNKWQAFLRFLRWISLPFTPAKSPMYF